mmetsp:Transcript_7573/g.18028  ORF Transcript_7573/g.18028 Transcript_7573/m.18028 type:complete len:84 (+) Transcript_7573:29-280(+)
MQNFPVQYFRLSSLDTTEPRRQSVAATELPRAAKLDTDAQMGMTRFSSWLPALVLLATRADGHIASALRSVSPVAGPRHRHIA